jgi:GABA permease
MGDLKRTLKTRHITMISIGGVIGTGLFVGTGKNILSTGPAAILSYLVACMIIVLIMQMVGEMSASSMTESSAKFGSFASYAGKYIGDWAGFTVGWLYWASWVFIIALEAVVIGDMLNSWFPTIPVWAGTVGITLLMTAINIFSVKSFGEFEYWLSFIKVTTIIVFLVVGLAMIMGIVPNFDPKGFGILTAHGGFAPQGIVPVFTGVVFVIFSICGAEVAAIAAGESENPAKNIVKAIKNVVFRLALFFVGSVAIIILVLPWNDEKMLAAPYANILEMAGLPIAGQVMQIVIFISLISVLNSALFTSSRMLLEMANNGDAPKFLASIKSRRGTPVPAIIVSTLVAYACALFYYVSPDVIFYFLANCVGGLMIIVYVFIAIAQIRFRRHHLRTNGAPLAIKMWLFPYLSYATIAMLVLIYVSQALIESLLMQFVLSTVVVIASIGLYFVMKNYKAKEMKSEMESLPADRIIES